MNYDDKIKSLKETERLGWEVFKFTGDISGYGMVVSSREMIKEYQLQKQMEESQNQPGM